MHCRGSQAKALHLPASQRRLRPSTNQLQVDIASSFNAPPFPRQLMGPVTEMWGYYCLKEHSGEVLCIEDWQHCRPPSTEDLLYWHSWVNIPVLRKAGTFPSCLPRHQVPKMQTLAAPLPFFPIGSTQISSRTHPGLSRTGLTGILGTKAKQIQETSFSARNQRLIS